LTNDHYEEEEDDDEDDDEVRKEIHQFRVCVCPLRSFG